MKTKTKPKSEVPDLNGAHDYFLFPFPESVNYFIEGLKYDPDHDNEQLCYEQKGKSILFSAHKILNELEYEYILASRRNKEINFCIFSRNKKTGAVKKKEENKPLPKQNLKRTVMNKVYEMKKAKAKTDLFLKQIVIID